MYKIPISSIACSIQHGETKMSAIGYPLDYIVKCNNQMMVAAGGNSALRL